MIHNPTDYRPDIDGLRAIAILSVVVFHAFPALLPGGFIGVDIFFVISGYLITNILVNDLESGQYSIKQFYSRRIRRIFPALLVILFCCLAAGWIILTAVEYESLGKHTAGGAAFVANFLLWKESGYFDAAASTKPLLHLWSLGVEEQFYIFWPVILYFLAKRPRHLNQTLLVIFFISFATNIWNTAHNPVNAFYSPWARFWELLTGSFWAIQSIRPGHKIQSYIAQHKSSLSVLGFAVLVACFTLIHEGANFPGWLALPPVLATGLLIVCGPDAVINRALLSRRYMVRIGLISFPLYLWHWPLLSFARIIYAETPPADIRVILICISIPLAWLTYLFIEKPIRTAPKSKKIIWLLSICMFVIFLAGLAISKSKGVKSRLAGSLNADPATLAMGADRARWQNECGIPWEAKLILKSCYSPKNGKAQYAVWGDSKGEAIYYGLARVAEDQGLPGWLMIGNTIPYLPAENAGQENRNDNKNQYAIDALIKNTDLKAVMLAPAARSIFVLGEVYTREDMEKSPYYEERLLGFSRAIHQLEAAGKKVFFLIDHPGLPDPMSCISGTLTSIDFLNKFLYRKENPNCSITYEQHVKTNQRYRAWIAALQEKHPGLIVYDPTHLVCDRTKNQCTFIQNGKFLYSYGDHYSDYANTMIAKDFLQKLSP